MRCRYLRQAFDLYKAGCARLKLSERNEGSCEHLKATLDSRLKRKCFKAIRGFNEKNIKAKGYCKILLGKMDHWMKKRAFKTWQEGGNVMKMESLTMEQNNLTDEMTVKNNELGGLTKRHADKSQRLADKSASLTRMGQRCMSNAFARAYFKRISRGFEQWKEWKRASKHKEMLMRRSLDHMLNRSGKYLLAIMMKWKALCNINDAKKNIAAMEAEMNDSGLIQNGSTRNFAAEKAKLREAVDMT
jgi:hypothetical protein